MKRNILRAAILVVVAVLGLFIARATATAGHPGSCPDSFTTTSASLDPIVNKNGDDWICTKQIGAGSGKTVFSDIDNNAGGGQGH